MFTFLSRRNQIITQYVFIVFRKVGHNLNLEWNEWDNPHSISCNMPPASVMAHLKDGFFSLWGKLFFPESTIPNPWNERRSLSLPFHSSPYPVLNWLTLNTNTDTFLKLHTILRKISTPAVVLQKWPKWEKWFNVMALDLVVLKYYWSILPMQKLNYSTKRRPSSLSATQANLSLLSSKKENINFPTRLLVLKSLFLSLNYPFLSGNSNLPR